jgi:hypothetical protein
MFFAPTPFDNSVNNIQAMKKIGIHTVLVSNLCPLNFMKEKGVEWWTAGRIKTILPNLDREQENRFLGTPAYCTIEFVFSANRMQLS